MKVICPSENCGQPIEIAPHHSGVTADCPANGNSMQLPEFAGMHWDAETLVAPLSPTLEVVEGLRRKALAVRKRGTAIVTVTACALAAYLHIRYVVIPNHSDIDFLSIFPSILALTVFYGVADHFFGSPLRRYKREFKHTARELLLAEGP